jgi:hypothetical protein
MHGPMNNRVPYLRKGHYGRNVTVNRLSDIFTLLYYSSDAQTLKTRLSDRSAFLCDVCRGCIRQMLGYWVYIISSFSSTLHIRNQFTIRCLPPFRRLLTTLQCVTQHICVSCDSRSSYRACSETALTGWSFGWTQTWLSVIFEVLYAIYVQFEWMLIFKELIPVIKYKHYVNKSESKGGGGLFDLFVWLFRLGRSRKLFEIMCLQFHKTWCSENYVDF